MTLKIKILVTRDLSSFSIIYRVLFVVFEKAVHIKNSLKVEIFFIGRFMPPKRAKNDLVGEKITVFGYLAYCPDIM